MITVVDITIVLNVALSRMMLLFLVMWLLHMTVKVVGQRSIRVVICGLVFFVRLVVIGIHLVAATRGSGEFLLFQEHDRVQETVKVGAAATTAKQQEVCCSLLLDAKAVASKLLLFD